jgi:integrase
MRRERTEITVAVVNRARAQVGKEDIEISDTKTPGLSIRVRSRGAVWTLRGRIGPKQSTWRIADCSVLTAPSAARERAIEARRLLARGIDPADWLREQEHGGRVERTFDPARDGWEWEDARSRYLDFIKAERATATYHDYRKTLSSADFQRWNGRLVKSISTQDIQSLRDSIYERGARVQANHTLRIIKAMFSWIAERAGSGITKPGPAAGVEPISLGGTPSDDTAGRVPSLAEIGDVPWKLDKTPVNPAARLAVMLTLLTAQRRETIASARRSAFRPAQDGGIWTISGVYMKSKRPHVIPLPPVAWAVVQAAMALGATHSDWLFPQLRLRRNGDSGAGHMSSNTLNDALFAAKSPFRPHDARRAFATYGESLLGFKRTDTKAILDHAEGQSGDVTAQHYALHDGTHFKWDIMRQWQDWVLQQMAARAPQGQTWPGFLPGKPLTTAADTEVAA